MTRYIIIEAPHLGPFRFATEAILAAIAIGADPKWKAVQV